jgi:hypothetical protein
MEERSDWGGQADKKVWGQEGESFSEANKEHLGAGTRRVRERRPREVGEMGQAA